MMQRNRNPRIVLALLSVAWSLYCCAVVKADTEIESFTRYRVDNFDNNSNGFVDAISSTSDLEDARIAEEIVANRFLKQPLAPLSNVPDPGTDPSTPLESSSTGFRDVIDNSKGGFSLSEGESNGGNSNTPSGAVFPSDFDDLVTLPTSFVEMTGKSYLQSCGTQIEKVIRFSPKLSEEKKKKPHPHNYWEVYYGLRYFQYDDIFGVQASGGVLGQMSIESESYNRTVGPHLGFQFNFENDDWRLTMDGLVQGGQYLGNAYVGSSIGEDLIPGQYNRPLYLGPHYSTDEQEKDLASLISVTRAQLSRRLTEWLTLHLGCSGYYIGNMRYAVDSIRWELPNMGVADNGTEEQIVTTAYTSLEFRR